MPICGPGRLGDVRIHRAHVEEDAAKLTHGGGSGRIHDAQRSVVDFNRAGTPLVEIVTEPDVHSPEQAREWLNLLRETIRALGVSDVDMSQGSLRCDANVSVAPVGSTELGVKTELKNMNSFAFLERGVRAEIERQIALLQAGEAITQETLHYDPSSGEITSLRSKEEAHDYRYFPEPDLPLLVVSARARRGRSSRAARAAQRQGGALPPPVRPQPRAGSRTGLQRAPRRLLRGALGAGGDGPDPVALANWLPSLVERIGTTADPAGSNVSPAALAELTKLVQHQGDQPGRRPDRGSTAWSPRAVSPRRSSRPRAWVPCPPTTGAWRRSSPRPSPPIPRQPPRSETATPRRWVRSSAR